MKLLGAVRIGGFDAGAELGKALLSSYSAGDELMERR